MPITTTPTRLYPRDIDAMNDEPTRDDIVCAAILAAFIAACLFSGPLLRWLFA